MEGLLPEQFPARKPGTVYKSCLLCPRCYRSCKRLQCKNTANSGRFFYKCPVPETDHKYFKWEDEARPHEFTQVPYCAGCNAGACRVKRETDGPDAGRVMFLCTLKEGQGTCGYRVWKDELERLVAEERMSPCQSTMVKCNNTDVAVNMEEESKQRDEGTDPNSPFNEISDDDIVRELILSQTMDREVISRTMDQTKGLKRKSITTSRRPHKRSRCGDIIGFPNSARGLTVCLTLNSMTNRHCWMKDAIRQNLSTELRGWWGRLVFHPSRCLVTYALRPSTSSVSYPLESSFVMRDILIHCSGLITPVKNSNGMESYRELSFSLEQEKILDSFHDETTSNELIHKPRSIMSKSISNAFHQAAECLQNELFARLEIMDVKDHEAMSEAAEATYAALDCLHFDYKDIKKRAEELIHCARKLAEINHVMPSSACYQRLVEICSIEREELDKINGAHAKAVEAVIKNKNRIKVLQEEIFDMEAVLSSCEVEVRSLELQLDKICKDKELMEGKYLITSKKLEKSQELLDQKEAEQNAAKAAFRRARTLLRG